jgi:sterol desaturase/sphingolipid hydroxylase (fatty acid hydroxylase superfamily)
VGDPSSTPTTERPGTTDGARRRTITLHEAFREFRRWPSPRIMAALLVPALAARTIVGGWSWVDLVLAVGMVVGQPLVEWTAHITLLHMRPLRIGRVTIDPLFARKHREHHADPRVLRLVFLPTPVVIQLAVVAVVVALFAFPRPGLGLTFLTTITAIGLVYEWTHYLVHTDYRPKRWLYRTLWTNHRLHHYKSEKYWFAFTSTYPDLLLGTAPDPASVATSPTVRDILGRAATTD